MLKQTILVIAQALVFSLMAGLGSCKQEKKSAASLREAVANKAGEKQTLPSETTTAESSNSATTELPANDRERRKREALERIRSTYEDDSMTLAARKTPDPMASSPLKATIGSDKMTADGKSSKSDWLRGCQSGNLQACHRFGWLQQKAGNQANAKRFYEVACEKGLLKSCNNLGWQAETEGRLSVALDYYARACMGKHPGSCQNLRRANEKARRLH